MEKSENQFYRLTRKPLKGAVLITLGFFALGLAIGFGLLWWAGNFGGDLIVVVFLSALGMALLVGSLNLFFGIAIEYYLSKVRGRS
jgi:hypothetical protein